MHYRKEFRDTVRAALETIPVFTGFTVLSAWSQNIDDNQLPCFGVVTPRETKVIGAMESSVRDTVLAVILKLKGGDALEDVMDDFSAEIEGVVGPSLANSNIECVLETTQITLDGGGERRIGTLTMEYRITSWLAEPLVI